MKDKPPQYSQPPTETPTKEEAVFEQEAFPTLPSIEMIESASLEDIGEDDFTLAEGGQEGTVVQRTDVVDPNSFVVAGEIARGGLGRILKARDKRLGRTVAIKEVIRGNERVRARLVREALITSRLQHPSIIPVYETGHWPSGEPFFTMKLVSGRPLDHLILQAKTLEKRLAALPHLVNVAEAIAYAHSKNIIHRDLKPANILVGEFGETVVIDWGLAKSLSDQRPEPEFAQRLTAVGAVIGTPAFMPPEQAAAMPLDERADVYSLGAILYCLLAATPPFTGKTPGAILGKVLQTPPVPLKVKQPGVPKELRRIVSRAMSRKPEDRYPDAKEFVEDLKRFQTQKLLGAQQSSGRQRRKRLFLIWASVLLFLIFLGLLAWGIFTGIKRAQRIIASVKEETVSVQKEKQILSQELVKEKEQSKSLKEKEQNTRAALADFFEKQGKEELLTGTPDRALLYLKKAYKLQEPSDRLLFLLSRTASPTAGHKGKVVHLAFSQDNRLAITAGLGGKAVIWNVSEQKILQTLKAHEASVLWAEFNDDATQAITASADMTAKVWNVKKGSLRFTLKGHTDQVLYASFSSDNKRIVTRSLDKTVKLWRSARGGLFAILGDEESYPIKDVAFSQDSSLVATLGENNIVKLWEAKNGKFVVSFKKKSDLFRKKNLPKKDDAIDWKVLLEKTDCYIPWHLEEHILFPRQLDLSKCQPED